MFKKILGHHQMHYVDCCVILANNIVGKGRDILYKRACWWFNVCLCSLKYLYVLIVTFYCLEIVKLRIFNNLNRRIDERYSLFLSIDISRYWFSLSMHCSLQFISIFKGLWFMIKSRFECQYLIRPLITYVIMCRNGSFWKNIWWYCKLTYFSQTHSEYLYFTECFDTIISQKHDYLELCYTIVHAGIFIFL
jgi:hypothetical protein